LAEHWRAYNGSGARPLNPCIQETKNLLIQDTGAQKHLLGPEMYSTTRVGVPPFFDYHISNASCRTFVAITLKHIGKYLVASTNIESTAMS
jgi:hypothetical protein